MTVNFKVSAPLFLRALECASKEETRYYLQGVQVEANPAGGALMIATDGSKLVVICDPDGYCEGAGIISADKAIRDACKPQRGMSVDPFLVGTGDRLGIAYNRDIGPEALASDPGAFIAVQLRGAFIDGSFPDWRRVIPHNRAAIESSVAFDQRHGAALAKALSGATGHAKSQALRFFGTGSDLDPFIVSGDGTINGFGVLMPMRATGAPESPPALWYEVTRSKLAAVA